MIVYIDEVGMSSIAGPVLTCAMVFKDGTTPVSGVKDSKKLTKNKRNELYKKLITYPHSFGTASIKEIKEMNVFWARFLAMRRAIEGFVSIGMNISKIIVDGKFTIPDLEIEQEAIIKADAKFWQVGAASILAKVKRDTLMEDLGKKEEYSHYDWKNNAGYYSPSHRSGIVLHGPCDLHRKEFVYFKYCLARHKEYANFIKQGNNPDDFLKDQIVDGKRKSDYTLWKEAKKQLWQPILPNVEMK